MILTPYARAYRLKVITCLGTNRQPITGPVSLEIELYPPDRRRRDIDNVQKAIFDALQYAKVYKDDSQVCRLLVQRYKPVKDGKIIVSIREIR